MYRTILLPLDGSAVAERSVPYAEALARASGARLLLLRAVRTQASAARGSAQDQVHAAHGARVYLASVAAQLDRRTVVETVVFPAPLAEAIRRETHVRNIDLIVMTPRVHSGPRRERNGRVAGQIVRRTEVPVLLVPAAAASSWPQDRRLCLLVPLDGCACADAALRYAEDLAAVLRAELLVLKAVVPPHGAGASAFPSSAATGETKPRDQEAMATGLGTSGRAVAARAAAGDRAAALATITHARGADMVVLPVHACGSLSHRELDHARAQILHHVRIPLLLVGPAAGRIATHPTPAARA